MIVENVDQEKMIVARIRIVKQHIGYDLNKMLTGIGNDEYVQHSQDKEVAIVENL